MKKMRLELLEHLCAFSDPKQVAKLGFRLIDEQVKNLREIGIEVDFPEIVILNGIEYEREKQNE